MALVLENHEVSIGKIQVFVPVLLGVGSGKGERWRVGGTGGELSEADSRSQDAHRLPCVSMMNTKLFPKPEFSIQTQQKSIRSNQPCWRPESALMTIPWESKWPAHTPFHSPATYTCLFRSQRGGHRRFPSWRKELFLPIGLPASRPPAWGCSWAIFSL